MCSITFPLCLEGYFIQTDGQIPDISILQLAASWFSWWVRVMLVPLHFLITYCKKKCGCLMSTLTSLHLCWCLVKRAVSVGRMLSEVSFFLLCPPPHTQQQQSFPLIPLSLVLHLLLCHCNPPHVGRKPKPLKNGLRPFTVPFMKLIVRGRKYWDLPVCTSAFVEVGKEF